MTPGLENITATGVMVTIILGAYGFAWKMCDGIERKIARIYERFDVHKKQDEERIERTCVLKSNCDIKHTNSDENFHRMERVMDDNFKELSAKIDRLQERLLDGKK